MIIEYTLKAITSAKVAFAFLALDEKLGPGTGAAIAIGASALMTVVFASIATYQLTLLFEMASGDEPDYKGVRPSDLAGQLP